MKFNQLCLIIAVLTSSFVHAQSTFETNGKFQFIDSLPAQENFRFGPGKLTVKGKLIIIGLEDENTQLTRIYKINAKHPQTIEAIEGAINNTEMSIYQPATDAKSKSLIVVAGPGLTWDDNDLYESQKDASGNYGELKALDALNSSESADAYPWLSANGKEIYYTRDDQIHYSSRSSIHTTFETGRPIHFEGNTDLDIISVWVSKNGKSLYFSTGSGDIYNAQKTGKLSFSEPELFTNEFTALDFISSISFDRKMKNLWFYLSDENNNSYFLHYRLK